jgi:hypothetical protein
MGLKDIIIPTAEVKLSDGSFAVRGLSLSDAVVLYRRHAGELSALFDRFATKPGQAVDPEETVEVVVGLIESAPYLVAEIISIAAGADSSDIEGFADIVAKMLNLPLGAQIDAVQKVGDLTFTSDMPPEKFVGLVLSVAGGAQRRTIAPAP